MEMATKNNLIYNTIYHYWIIHRYLYFCIKNSGTTCIVQIFYMAIQFMIYKVDLHECISIMGNLRDISFKVRLKILDVKIERPW